MKIVLLGPQGSGKGTLAKMIVKEFDVPHISVGDLFRDYISRKEEIGLYAKTFMDRGELVPDEVTVKMLGDRLGKNDCKNGFILDGFPRTIAQGKSLEKIVDIDGVILLDLPYSTAVERLVTRRVCSSCGEIYNIRSYDKNVCQKCGAPLYQRDDDKLEAIKNRLEVYDRELTPLINFYSGKLHRFDGSGSPDEVYAKVKTFLLSLEDKK